MKKNYYIVIIIGIFLFVGCSQPKVTDANEQGNKIGNLISPYNDIGKVTSDIIMKIEKGMTYHDIIEKLGKTNDIGSGLYLAQYIVDDKLILTISFGNLQDICDLTGQELLEKSEPVKK